VQQHQFVGIGDTLYVITHEVEEHRSVDIDDYNVTGLDR
jgi:hypothetical protein